MRSCNLTDFLVHAPVRQANIGICSPPLLPAFLVDSWPKVKIRLDGGKNNVISPPLDLSHADIPAGTRDEPTFPWEDKSHLNRILACIEMKSIFYDVLQLKRASKIKKPFFSRTAMQLVLKRGCFEKSGYYPPHLPPFVYKSSQNPLRSRISPLLFSGSWRLFFNEDDAVKLLKHGVFWESNKAFLRLVSPLAVWFSFHDEHPCHFYVGEPLLFIRRLGSISTAAINLINTNSE